MEKEEIIKIQKELMDLYESQMIDLSLMSKIDIGEDVIKEIIRLKQLLNK